MNAKRYSIKMTEAPTGEYVPYNEYAILLQKYNELEKNTPTPIFAINKNLDISTAHISEKDSEQLASNGDKGTLIVHPYEEGYFIYVEKDQELFEITIDKLIKERYSHAFIEIMKLAHDLECAFIHLDSDGTEYKHMLKFDW
jgi:hypothetical protein